MLSRLLQRLTLDQQIAGLACGCSALVIILVMLIIGRSLPFITDRITSNFGASLTAVLAQVLEASVSSNDLITISAELELVRKTGGIVWASVYDADNVLILQVGDKLTGDREFRREIMIREDLGGFLVTGHRDSLLKRDLFFLIVSLWSLLLLLTITVFFSVKAFVQLRLAPMNSLLKRLPVPDDFSDDNLALRDEILRVIKAVERLPIDLIYQGLKEPREHLELEPSTALLLVRLRQLNRYQQTLDKDRLHEYVAFAHNIMKATASFYGGKVRAAGTDVLVVVFNEDSGNSSAIARAALCGLLLRSLADIAEQNQSLKLNFALAIGLVHFDTGEREIYKHLLVESAIDKLEVLSKRVTQEIAVTENALSDDDFARCILTSEIPQVGAIITSAEDEELSRLQQQLKILKRALFPGKGNQTDLPF